jgi:hypothetical protein
MANAFSVRRGRATILLVVLVALIATRSAVHSHAHEHDVTAWTSPRSRPLSDAQAAALVTRTPEVRPGNAAANRYVPSTAQLAAFHAAQRRAGFFNPLTAYVTGRPGIPDPSTDDLIQWVSHKWGIPTDWIRADLVVESDWYQGQRGDRTAVGPAAYRSYPPFSRIAGTADVYTSLGIAQVKWLPEAQIGIGTEPLRWESTAFNLDFFAASVRYYYDGYCGWCTSGYSAGETWNSIGAWDSPEPWENALSRAYLRDVQLALALRAWTHGEF